VHRIRDEDELAAYLAYLADPVPVQSQSVAARMAAADITSDGSTETAD
jgi:hypothetical protein